jgi:hypothetical protein
MFDLPGKKHLHLFSSEAPALLLPHSGKTG